jgi:hypothetical protein
MLLGTTDWMLSGCTAVRNISYAKEVELDREPFQLA